MTTTGYARRYLDEVRAVAEQLDAGAVEDLVRHLATVRDRDGRVFVAGVGGGAGNASHAAADLRALAGIEAYSPTDNVSGFTALVNDHGWDASISIWLEGSRLGAADALLVLSVGGGSVDPPVSVNLVEAVRCARQRGATVLGITGRDGGETARHADRVVIVPTVDSATVTAHTESFQAVIWHLAVTHPDLRRAPGRWESLQAVIP